MRYELSERARADIFDIAAYSLEHFGRRQAEEYLSGLYYSFDLLMDNPRLGRVFDQRVRCYVYRSHYVFYAIRTDVIRIATLRHVRQALPDEFEE